MNDTIATATIVAATGAALPALATARLVLRPFVRADAPRVQELAGAREIADTALNMPHPYPDGAAEAWIATHAQAFAEGKGLTLAVALKNDLLIGCVSLGISPRHRHAEIGYWIGKDYWGKGHCTEAAFEIVRFGFERLGLHRVFGECLRRNPASARVMQKIGMSYEGCMRQHVRKGDQFENMEIYGLIREGFLAGIARFANSASMGQ